MSNPPAHQYYPADYAADPIVRFWTMEQKGCYQEILDYLWINGGLMTEDLGLIRDLFRVKRRDKAELMWSKIKVKFEIKNGIITHNRVTKEMQRQAEYRLKKSNAGKKGMESRYKKDNSVTDVLLTKTNSSSSPSPSPSTTVNNTHTQSNFTLDHVIDTGKMMGVTPDKAEEFYHHFNAQGWLRSNGQRITNLQSAMVYWRNHQSEFKKGIPNANTSKTPVSIYEDDTATSAKRL